MLRNCRILRSSSVSEPSIVTKTLSFTREEPNLAGITTPKS